MFSRTSIYYFLYFYFLLLPVIVSMRRQSVGVKGKLLCGNQPLHSATILLSDEDSGPEFDDKMAEGTTNANGQFQIHGTEVEFTSIEPRLTILHKCNYKWICKREVTFHIPRKYINHGKSVKKWFDLGTLNMETVFPGEEHNCFRIFW